MNHESYNTAVSSEEHLLSFIVDTQYPTLITRAISATLVTTNVGEEALYDALEAAAKSGSPVFDYVLDFPLETSDHLSPAANETITMINARLRAGQRRSSQQAPSYCDPSFTGPLSPTQQSNCDNFNANSGGGGGLSSSNIDGLITAGGAILAFFGNMFGNEPDENSTTNPPPATTPPPEDSDNTLWYVGAAVVAILIMVGVILYVKKK